MTTCRARGCTVPCIPEFLLCPRHWKMVPAWIQARVWRYYREGQCDDGQVSPEFSAAANAAIATCAAKEWRISKRHYEQAMRGLREIMAGD